MKGRVSPSVRPVFFSSDEYMAIFESKKSSNDNMINDMMSDDDELASDVPPRYLFYDTQLEKPY